MGKENDLEQIERLTPDVLNTFRSLKPYLEPFAPKSEGPGNEFDKEAVKATLNKLIESIDDFDLGSAEEAAKKLGSYSYDEDLTQKMEALDKHIFNLDYDEAKELAEQILDIL